MRVVVPIFRIGQKVNAAEQLTIWWIIFLEPTNETSRESVSNQPLFQSEDP